MFSSDDDERIRSVFVSVPAEKTVTQLLRAWSCGDRDAFDQLMPQVYGTLHKLAHHYMAQERQGNLLQTTALINEAYLRLVNTREAHPLDRTHFYALSAQMMRRVLVDHARSCHRQKRGGEAEPLPLDEACTVATEPNTNLVVLDEALTRLATFDGRKCQIVELRFFGGLTVEEAAEALEISPETAHRDWELAKVWLYREMKRK
jgi:RNA polymerase sigma-70 factor, ECF subfamily